MTNPEQEPSFEELLKQDLSDRGQDDNPIEPSDSSHLRGEHDASRTKGQLPEYPKDNSGISAATKAWIAGFYTVAASATGGALNFDPTTRVGTSIGVGFYFIGAMTVLDNIIKNKDKSLNP